MLPRTIICRKRFEKCCSRMLHMISGIIKLFHNQSTFSCGVCGRSIASWLNIQRKPSPSPLGWRFIAGFHVDHPIPKDDFGLIKLAIIDLVTLVTMLFPSIIRGSCKIVPSSNDWPNKNSRRYMMEIFG